VAALALAAPALGSGQHESIPEDIQKGFPVPDEELNRLTINP
jgi:hypothetical protein